MKDEPWRRDACFIPHPSSFILGFMNITVLYGGPSAEREVSLVSGRAVAQGLREAGHAVHEVDVRPETLDSALNSKAFDVVFPVLHGTWGEDGQLQAVLEARGVRF